MKSDRRWLKLMADVISLASLLFLGLWLLFFALNDFAEGDILDAISNTVSYLAFSGIGLLIILRQPTNLIGWICAVVGLFAFLGLFANEYTTYAFSSSAVALPLREFVAWTRSWTWTIPVMIPTLLLPALFPDGRPLSRPWHYVIGAGLVAIALTAGLSSLAVDEAQEIANPFAVDSAQPFLETAGAVAFAVWALAFIACVVSALLRFRRSSGQARLQMEWFAYSIPPAVALAVANNYVSTGDESNFLFGIGLTLVVASIGISVLRYHLYDIDLIVNRTLVYGLLTALLAGLYAACIQLFKLLFEGATGETSEAAVVLTTLVLAAAFTPAKTRLQKIVDHYFGQVHEPLRDLQTFADELRAILLLEVEEGTRRFLDTAMGALSARGGAINLTEEGRTVWFFKQGEWPTPISIEVMLQHTGQQLGSVMFGSRRDGADYSEEETSVVESTADLFARTIALTSHVSPRVTGSVSHEGLEPVKAASDT